MANDFAVIETGGKQYRVSAGAKFKVEKLDVKAGDTVVFDTVLLTSVGDAVKVGAALECMGLAVSYWAAADGGADLIDLLREGFTALGGEST